MSNLAGAGIPQLISEIRTISANIANADEENKQAIADLQTKLLGRLQAVESNVDGLYLRNNRPGAEAYGSTQQIEYKDAVELLHVKHMLDAPRDTTEYKPTPSQVDEALTYRKAFASLFRNADANALPPEHRKSLSGFQFGTNSYILPPTVSNQVLRCIVDPTDVLGLFNTVNISSGSIKFPIDNTRMVDEAAWACQTDCFHNNPVPDLAAGLGELEIKAEELRYVVCVTNDLKEDASFDIQNWVLQKVEQGFRNAISNAILVGDGLSKPLGLFSPRSGLPVCEVSENTPPGQFSWQDIIQVRFELPIEWQNGAAYLMNARTFAMLATMADGLGRPLWGQLPDGMPGFQIGGTPIKIVTQLPDIAPGATPVLYGNLKKCFTIVNRRATTMIPDPYSANWCTLLKFSARCGGAVTCPNAARLLRIK